VPLICTVFELAGSTRWRSSRRGEAVELHGAPAPANSFTSGPGSLELGAEAAWERRRQPGSLSAGVTSVQSTAPAGLLTQNPGWLPSHEVVGADRVAASELLVPAPVIWCRAASRRRAQQEEPPIRRAETSKDCVPHHAT
jgi:hypothetical protein